MARREGTSKRDGEPAASEQQTKTLIELSEALRCSCWTFYHSGLRVPSERLFIHTQLCASMRFASWLLKNGRPRQQYLFIIFHDPSAHKGSPAASLPAAAERGNGSTTKTCGAAGKFASRLPFPSRFLPIILGIAGKLPRRFAEPIGRSPHGAPSTCTGTTSPRNVRADKWLRFNASRCSLAAAIPDHFTRDLIS